VASDSDFEVAEGDRSAQTDLEELDRFLHNFGTNNNNDDDHKDTGGAEGDPLVSFASSLTVEEADNLSRSLSAETADKPNPNNDAHIEPPAGVGDPMVSLIADEVLNLEQSFAAPTIGEKI
jgi:hypothetical protein